MTQRFDGKIVVITGAGKGLGRAYALWFAARGATVVVNNRTHPETPSSAQAVVDEIVANGGAAMVDHNSIETEAGANSLIETAIRAGGRIDVLVCNAGIVEHTAFSNLSSSKMREVMDVNFWGTLYPIRAAFPAMVQAGYGRVILSTSQAGLFGQRETPVYAASKAAMIGLARALALEVGEADIRFNIIAPAALTQMARPDLAAKLNDLMSPDKVAPVVGWLGSSGCQKSGLIFNSGAGRTRRARILETMPVDFNEEFDGNDPKYESMDNLLEASDTFASVRVLIPELFHD